MITKAVDPSAISREKLMKCVDRGVDRDYLPLNSALNIYTCENARWINRVSLPNMCERRKCRSGAGGEIRRPKWKRGWDQSIVREKSYVICQIPSFMQITSVSRELAVIRKLTFKEDDGG